MTSHDPPRPRVLIADDEPDAAMALAKFYGSWGWEAVTVADGAAALARIAEPFDLWALDLMMPLVDGAAVLREARARGLTTPAAVMTGMTRESALALIAGLDPVRLFNKPYELKDVEAHARSVLVVRRHDQ